MNARTIGNYLQIILVIVIVPFILLSFFNHPSADDYCYAKNVLEEGFVNFQLQYYWLWSGRLFATAAISGYPLFTNFIGLDFAEGYALIGLTSITFIFAAVFLLLKGISRDFIAKKTIFWGALAFVSIYVNRMPSSVEGIYWLSGAATYTWGSCLALIALSIVLSLTNRKNEGSDRSAVQTFLYGTIGLILIFIATCSNEMTAIVMIVTLGAGTCMAFIHRSSLFFIWGVSFLTALGGTAVSFLSPGNFNRHSGSEHLSFLSTLYEATDAFRQNVSAWALDPILLGSTVLILPTAFFLVSRTSLNQYFSKKSITAFLMLWISCLFISFCLPYFAGGYLPGRSINISYLLFLVGWFVMIGLFCSFSQNNQSYTPPRYIYKSAQIVVILGLLFESNFLAATKDLVGRAPSYHSQFQSRYEVIANSLQTGEKQVAVDSIKNRPRTIFFADIESDPEHWVNTCQADFFQLESIKVNGSP